MTQHNEVVPTICCDLDIVSFLFGGVNKYEIMMALKMYSFMLWIRRLIMYDVVCECAF